MNTHRTIKAILAGLVCSAFLFPSVQADSVNEKRVLKKAGGNTEGMLTNIVITTVYADMSPTTTVTSFDRTGEVKIPKKKGSTATTVVHGGEERDLDSNASGSVKKPKVKKNGKKIVYKASGQTTPIFDSDTNFSGGGKAVSKVKGKKVKTTGSVSGSRVKMNGDVESVTANVEGQGKF